MRYHSELNGNTQVDFFTSFGQHLVEADVSEERGSVIAEAMNEIDEKYSETMCIEFLDNVGVGGDIAITEYLTNDFTETEIEVIRIAFKEDARVNMW